MRYVLGYCPAYVTRARNPVADPVPAGHEENILRYAERVAAGLDIWTGKPLKPEDVADAQPQAQERNGQYVPWAVAQEAIDNMRVLLHTTALSDREIGATVGCSGVTVGNYRRRWGIPVASERGVGHEKKAG